MNPMTTKLHFFVEEEIPGETKNPALKEPSERLTDNNEPTETS